MIAGANDVVATVTSHNHTSKVTKGEVFTFFSRYPLPPVDERDIAYHIAVENLINPILLNEFLARLNIPVKPEMVEDQIGRIKEHAPEGKDGLDHASEPDRFLDGRASQGDREPRPMDGILQAERDRSHAPQVPQRQSRPVQPAPRSGPATSS